jgi:hypothetical protein
MPKHQLLLLLLLLVISADFAHFALLLVPRCC